MGNAGIRSATAVDDAPKVARIDTINEPDAYAHVNAAWAWGTNSPFEWAKLWLRILAERAIPWS
ncbi:hypothetical protein RM533_00555 [Croceicoccus sp. F390]|uniref:Uncharacterized protein n=1 Tax=Croceicoccus esteveae TaxID=3075597 RepID=A0ABU2ZGX5_9SPHN|nr:hypothetical protein [Croceicoccus sp. F390]MDT0574667.1 hypothetical protein [Croceicoccus sp. F390]